MARTTLRITAMLACVASATVVYAQAPGRVIPGRYIVVLDDRQVGQPGVRAAADDLARQYAGRVEHVYEHTIHGFSVRVSNAGAAALARNPRVRYVEQDTERFIVETQSSATWGLDRVDQRQLPLDGSYTYDTVASNVGVYVIDTGIRATHAEFEGRVSGFGFTSIDDENGTDDCNGHGTHVSGTIGGATYGVAKFVTLYAVRVLGCNGAGTTAGVIAGVDWVTANQVRPAVANMSLIGGPSTALDDAVRGSIAAGVTYAIAAGNSSTDACNYSPARVAEALTVASSTSYDARSSFSNFGPCIDVFAPGSDITSAWNTSDTASATISGTSMATPHVAGAAALYLALDPLASPDAVNAAIVNSASINMLSGIGSGSPNRLLYSHFGAAYDPPPAATFTYSCAGLTCTFDGSGSSDNQGIAAYTWAFGDGEGDASSAIVTHTYAAGGTFLVQLTVADTANQTAVAAQSVTAASSEAPCTECVQYPGTLPGPGYYDLQPNGSYYYSSVSGLHSGWLQGPPDADFDLYLYKWNGFFWSLAAWSAGPGSEERVAYPGTPGFYVWFVYANDGPGDYTFWLQVPDEAQPLASQ